MFGLSKSAYQKRKWLWGKPYRKWFWLSIRHYRKCFWSSNILTGRRSGHQIFLPEEDLVIKYSDRKKINLIKRLFCRSHVVPGLHQSMSGSGVLEYTYLAWQLPVPQYLYIQVDCMENKVGAVNILRNPFLDHFRPPLSPNWTERVAWTLGIFASL